MYVLVRLLGFAGVEVRAFPDTFSYVDVARRSLLSLDFLASERSWTLPLLYKLPSDGARAWGQVVISLVCWLALATAVAATMRSRRMTVAAFGVVLLFSCSEWVMQWDPVLLSESISISLTAGVLALWITMVQRPSWAMVAVLLVGSLFWVFVRDTNAYVGLIALPALVVWAIRARAGRARAVVLAAGTLVLFLLSSASASTELAPRHRWLTPMLNVLGARILADEARTDWFSDRGLPVTPKLREQAGAIAGLFGPNRTVPPPLWTDPELGPALQWARDEMRTTYARYLVTHPKYALAPLVSKRDVLLSVEPRPGLQENYPIAYYRSETSRALLPPIVDRALFPVSSGLLLIWLAGALAAAVVALLRVRPDRRWLVPLLLLVVTPAHLLLVWHGDAGEVTRHAVVAGVGLRLGIVLLLLLAADEMLTVRKGRVDKLSPVGGTAPVVQ